MIAHPRYVACVETIESDSLMSNSSVIVTKETINSLLAKEQIRVDVIGRALVGIFKRQTDAEQSSNTTNTNNTIGFTGADAFSGSLTAKYYMKHGTLQPWQVEKWLKPNRIAKYHRQLNEIAQEKKAA
jgi:hypothetical protein